MTRPAGMAVGVWSRAVCGRYRRVTGTEAS